MDILNSFNTPYEQYKERNGESFELIGAVDPSTYDFSEVGVMYSIKFPDGIIIEAYPEEIFEGFR